MNYSFNNILLVQKVIFVTLFKILELYSYISFVKKM